MKWQHWTLVVLGGWLVLSPWILGYASVNLALWNGVAAGAFIAILAAWAALPPGE